MDTRGLRLRIIPVLLLRDGMLVISRNFNFYQAAGNPLEQVSRLNDWNVDELIYLDIAGNGRFDIETTSAVIGSTSSKKKHFDEVPKNRYEFIGMLSKKCFMPLCFGGGVKNMRQIEQLLKSGADKVAINSAALLRPSLIYEAAKEFGSQAVIVSMDCKKVGNQYKVFSNGGSRETEWTSREWAIRAKDLGAGELLVNSIDRDGSGQGYDIELYKPIIDCIDIPVIVLGGVSNLHHFSEGYFQLRPNAMAAANIFHFVEHCDQKIKEHLISKEINVRSPFWRKI